MKVLFDYQTFQLQKFGGISRYFFELFKQYNIHSEVKWVLPIKYSNNEYLKELPEYKNLLELPVAQVTKQRYKDFMWGWQFKGKWQLYSLKNIFFKEPAPKPLPNAIE